MILRPYQEEVLTKARQAIQSGNRRPVIVLGTGLGKTATAVEAVRRHVERGGKVLWAAPRIELVDQAIATLAGIPANVATVQTLLARDHRPEATMVVLDEARHYLSTEWSKLPSYYSEAIILGLDATPARGDGVGMGMMFNAIIQGITVRQAITEGYLVPSRIVTTAKPLPTGEIAQLPVDAYIPGKRAVCFAANVVAAEQHASEFRAGGYRSEVIIGDMPAARRQAVLAAFACGDMDCIVSVGVLNEGWDAPICDCVILATRCGTPGIYLQRVGRGLRPYPGKTECLLIDLTGMVHIHGTPEEDRIYSLEGLGIRRASEVDERFCQLCGVVLTPLDVVCPDCGREPEVMTPPKVKYEKLKNFVYRPRATDEEKLEKLKRWVAIGRARGYKNSWPIVRYTVEFGCSPSGSFLKEAMKND